MKEFLFTTIEFISQFTGGQGGINYVVQHGIGAMLFAILLAVAILQRYHSKEEREMLLVWGFGFAFSRELFMVLMAYLQVLKIIEPTNLHVIFPPLEHALSNIAMVVIAAAFLKYLLADKRISELYLKTGTAAIAFCYLATFWWWAQYITQFPDSKFGQTWCDWLFRIVASILMLAPIYILNRRTRGWLRNTTCLAFAFFFLNEFLKLPDMALGEVYEHIFAPIRHGLYIIAIPLFGYVYFREMYEERRKVEQEKFRMENRLRHSHKMEAIGSLAGGIAHDFNNMLTVIIGNTDLALADTRETLPAHKRLLAIEKAACRSKNLVEQILSFSRKSDQKHMPVKPSTLVRETVNLLRSTIPTTIDIRLEIDEKCGPIIADPSQVHQILMNLATNSVHAMDEKGILAIRLEEIALNHKDLGARHDMLPGDYLLLTVSDNGSGIDPKLASRIFDPFFTTKEAGIGTGMGLAVVHGIVMAHHGMITFDSRPGEGTTFKVFFALADAEEVKLAKSAAPLPSGDEKILCVDDEAEVLEVEKEMLSRQGFDVTVTTSSREALDIFRSEPDRFDLVISDQTMPEMSGLELAKELIRIKVDVPIIIATGYSNKISEQNIKELGIRKVCLKPLNQMQLLRSVREVLDDR